MILDGKVVSEKVLEEVRAGVSRLKSARSITPMLAVVLIGDFAPSKIYVAQEKGG